MLVHSLDLQAIARGLVRQAVPFLGDLCALRVAGESSDHQHCTHIAWIDPSDAAMSPDQP